MKYAIIKNNVVVNVIVAEQDFIDEHYPDAILLDNESNAGIGYIYENNKFIEPEIIEAEEVTPTPALEG